MKYSSKIEKCGLSPMRKFSGMADDAKKRGIRIYPLNIGQPDVKTPDIFFDTLRSFSEPVLAYAPSDGIPELLDAVREYYGRIGVKLDRKDILVASGGSEAFQMIMACILDDGDEIIIPEPFYPNYATAVTLAGGVIRPVPTSPENGYFYADRKNIERCINEKTRAIFITSPGNPTGNVLSRDDFKVILDIAKEHGLFLVCDEVYREFVYSDEPLLSSLQFEGYEDNVIVIDSVSKRFSACGARIGMVISKNERFMEQALKWCQCRLCSATVDQLGAAALYSLPDGYFDEVKKEYNRRRDTMIRKLHEIPGVKCETPKGAFYVMVSLPVDDADKLQQFMLTEFDDNGDTVLLACGEPFYATPGKGRNEVRLAYTICCEDIERAIDILKKAIEKYNSSLL